MARRAATNKLVRSTAQELGRAIDGLDVGAGHGAPSCERHVSRVPCRRQVTIIMAASRVPRPISQVLWVVIGLIVALILMLLYSSVAAAPAEVAAKSAGSSDWKRTSY